ncbi:LiaF transmembrane domain-containing protein [Xanthovirga aplysinae]|uniref:LiaF transmembrane domain-containing protein n=1 Tax=Xanthovirga aplysinae TaxID=2529853 RepID=UPI0012BC703E|nr:DUF5668 domain-containing protein [Xanthovirga aplysinae]MTI30471.1 hypothetical protein [Xanthovirga aplysinae]
MSQRSTNKANPSENSQPTSVGLILIVLGSIFLLKNFNLIPWEVSHYIFNWKGIMVSLGAIFLITKENKNTGLILMTIGGFFIIADVLSDEFRWFWYDFRKLFWPVLLILIGLLILRRKGKAPLFRDQNWSEGDPTKGVGGYSDHLNINAVLSGGDIRVTSKNFKGGKITTIFGGGTIDLSAAELAEGTQEIDLFVLFGGNNFIVPSDWNVRIEVTSIFGGFNDSRKFYADVQTDHTKELIIKGTVLFGGGEVKNYV